MLQILSSCLEKINSFLWNGPMILLLLGTHLFFTVKLCPQRFTLRALRLSVRDNKASDGNGLGSFAALSTTLAATLGTGNIVGVSTAIALGGPGALFWCFLTGLLGMSTSYAECYLSCLHRERDSKGRFTGGPMYVLRSVLNRHFAAGVYSLCLILAAIGSGCTTQSSAMADAAQLSFHLSPHLTGVLAAVITGSVILGGADKVGRFCTRLVPPLSLLYMGACLLLLWQNRSVLPDTFSLIFSAAFTTRAAGGGFVGSTLLMSSRFGIARGLFTNEAGIGTAAVTAGSSASESPVKQALISMTAVFWDTIVMCTLTGLTIISSMLAHPGSTAGLSDAELTSAAFSFLPFCGNMLLSAALIAFALATLVGWCYLGEKGVTFLFGETGVRSYHLVYIVMIYVGAILPMELVWSFTDFINAAMVLPNLLCLFLLAKGIRRPARRDLH